jgi:hypothetical protein
MPHKNIYQHAVNAEFIYYKSIRVFVLLFQIRCNVFFAVIILI